MLRRCARPVLLAAAVAGLAAVADGGARGAGSPLQELIPKPARVVAGSGSFKLTGSTRVVVSPRTPELRRIAAQLAAGLGVRTARTAPAEGAILLTTVSRPSLGAEGYELAIAPSGVTLTAHRPAGLFYGVQSVLQLLPVAGGKLLPAATIRDRPRFAWRGAMLDVARHFFEVEDVKRFVDQLARYKLNRLHLHLTDDQGWRIGIRTWPRLTRHGGKTEVGGGPGGHFTQREYADIVRHARSRYVEIVPEIDMPGHTAAALSSYPELSCDGAGQPLYTGIDVGFSSLCIGKPVTYRFVDDVLREVAALTSGRYVHIGGDEAKATKPADYVAFVDRVQRIVRSHGKRMIGWSEIGAAKLHATTIVQHWQGDRAVQAVASGAKLIMSPAEKTYLDMKYERTTKLGLKWAGYTSVRDAYEWDPATHLDGVGEKDVLGVEAPLWSETLRTAADVDFLAFPRLLGHAEISWSPREGRSWREYRRRLAAHGPRLDALGVGFYRAPDVPWR